MASDPLDFPTPSNSIQSSARLLSGSATFEAFVRHPLEIGVPGLKEARQLLRVASPLFSSDQAQSTVQQFEKPSNPVFQSNEYRSVNCCIPGVLLVCYPIPPFPPGANCKFVKDYSLLNRTNCNVAILQSKLPSSNGCSTPLSNTPFKSDFTPACNQHDICYSTCLSNRRSCDATFRKNMQQACDQKYYNSRTQQMYENCMIWSTNYYTGVRVAGNSYFENAQIDHCKCCSESTS